MSLGAFRRREGARSLFVRIPASLHHRLRVHCAVGDVSLRQFVIEALEEKLAKEERPPENAAPPSQR